MSLLDSAVKLQSEFGKASKLVNEISQNYLLIKNGAAILKNINKKIETTVQTDARSVDKFMRVFNEGFLRQNEFEFYLYPPMSLHSHPAITTKKILFATKAVELPNITFTQQKIGYGNFARTVATGVDHDPINITCLVDGGAQVVDFFEKWMQLMYNPETYEMSFRSEYMGSADIFVYNRPNPDQQTDLVEALVYNLLSVYPLNKDKISLSYDNENVVMELQLTLNYDSYRYANFTSPFTLPSEKLAKGKSIIDMLKDPSGTAKEFYQQYKIF